MKNLKKTGSVIASAFISLCFLVGCSESVDNVNTGGLILDMDVQPTQTAVYEGYTNEALNAYFDVADKHLLDDGDIDYENDEVKAAARNAAAKLFAYACYNERQLDQYVFFSAQEGDTEISAGSATAMKQEYYLRINENENTCGYRYHYTIKMVKEISGTISMFKGLFESARMRITDKTDLLYRLEGEKIRVGERNETFGVDMLECDWKTGSDWGTPELVVKKADYIEPENIIADIEENAGVDIPGVDSCTIRGNINILADDIVKSAFIIKDTNEADELDGYVIFMEVDTEVANKDEASLKMLRLANSSSNCLWVNEDENSGLSIVFRIWKNGLFRMYSVSEKWQGTINGYSGTADSSTQYYYSYSDRDCDMSRYLGVIETVKS